MSGSPGWADCVELHYGDVVDMQQAAQPMKLIRTLKEDEYFHILRTKLKWGKRFVSHGIPDVSTATH